MVSWPRENPIDLEISVPLKDNTVVEDVSSISVEELMREQLRDNLRLSAKEKVGHRKWFLDLNCNGIQLRKASLDEDLK